MKQDDCSDLEGVGFLAEVWLTVSRKLGPDDYHFLSTSFRRHPYHHYNQVSDKFWNWRNVNIQFVQHSCPWSFMLVCVYQVT